MRTCEITEHKDAPASSRTDVQPCAKPVLPAVAPATDVYHTESALHLVVELPGVADSGVEIDLEDRLLRVSAETAADLAEGQEWMHREFRSRRFERSFRLSDRVDESRISASMKHGILRIEIPFRSETMPRRIEIKAG